VAEQKRDYYEVLGVDRASSAQDIKKAFRQLARQYHPDANPGAPNTEARFKEINEAYEVLGDEEKRARYDQFGHAAFSPGAGGPGPGYGTGPGYGGFEEGGSSPFGGIEDLLSMFFGQGARRAAGGRAGPTRGADLRYDLTIAFEEAAFGVRKEIQVPRVEQCVLCNGTGARPGTRPATCLACGGTGEVQSVQGTPFGRFVSVRTCERCRGTGKVAQSPCPDCGGSGHVKRHRRIAVDIPAGVDDGSRVRLPGEGGAGGPGGAAGDLYVIVRVRPHRLFVRHGQDVYSRMGISLYQAALGASIDVETLDGAVKLRVPPGTQTGTRFRMRGRGIPRLRAGGRGDHHVEVQLRTPTNLNAEERRLLRELARLRGELVEGERGVGDGEGAARG